MKASQDRGIDRLVAGELRDPHGVLGAHPAGKGTRITTYKPDAQGVKLLIGGNEIAELDRLHHPGVFETVVDSSVDDYELEVVYAGGSSVERDPYCFPPTVGDMDLHFAGEGSHRRLYRTMGAQCKRHADVDGVGFAVWAPNARSVRLVGDFNAWDGRRHPMRALGSSGIWELFVPGLRAGTLYKFEILTAQGHLVVKTDPFAFATEVPPGTASIVHASRYEWGDQEWVSQRDSSNRYKSPMSIYELHLGSWRRTSAGEPLTYSEIGPLLADYCTEMGFTHVQFMPVAEHPYGGSWGYQVSHYFAPTARYGSPDDFRGLVDTLHQAGIGIIVDWVPAHFPKDTWGLARFDGTALYEHDDPRKGEHPDWGTLVFNFGRNEVRNFLISSALYWIEEFHLDGLRVDAVASMIYLDYSREEGEWVPNEHGGRENLEAIEFLTQFNSTVYDEHPGIATVAEESTAWPGVSRPVHLGGLGFGFKWNMGWMHDTLEFFARDPIYRGHHHDELTFSFVYAWGENYVLPLSHDEVVHGKRSLLGRMPGDAWQRLANLRSLFAYMWAHPGKQLLFMGGEVAQESEWNHEQSIDWHLLDDAGHAGVQRLVADLNKIYFDVPALWQQDFTSDGFRWIDANDAENNVVSFLRRSDDDEQQLACICNLTPVVRHGYRLGLPAQGTWGELLNSDAEAYGGSGVGNAGSVEAEAMPWHGLDYSAVATLPPLGVLWLLA
ncbi:MAG: 1,4-alpha-glucan branching protein GlgB [Actinobacteria bacterium]|nr:1,4-alpha-glucan branching protein GlgB [Actinomycetota bacterium]